MTNIEWFMHNDNIILLAHFLADNGATAKEVAIAIEKPWNYESSFNEAKAATMTTLILSPAYGEDYETKEEALIAWNAGKDFFINNLDIKGAYANIRDMDMIREQFDHAYVRYNRLTKTVTIYERKVQ